MEVYSNCKKIEGEGEGVDGRENVGVRNGQRKTAFSFWLEFRLSPSTKYQWRASDIESGNRQ